MAEPDEASALGKRQAFVFDVDGTLVEFTDDLRRHFAEATFDLDAYHAAAVHQAPASDRVLTLLKALQRAGIAIVMSTYREESYRSVTLALFDRLGVWPDKTYMRLEGDRDLPNFEVKAKHLDRIVEAYDVIGMADDDPAIAELCQRRGIPVLVVPGWRDPG